MGPGVEVTPSSFRTGGSSAGPEDRAAAVARRDDSPQRIDAPSAGLRMSRRPLPSTGCQAEARPKAGAVRAWHAAAGQFKDRGRVRPVRLGDGLGGSLGDKAR